MRTRLAIAALLAILSLPIIASPASANVGGCNQDGMIENFNGQTNSSPNVTRTGVKATGVLSNAFGPCIPNFDFEGGPAIYVEISLRTQHLACQPYGCAVRLGVIECTEVPMGVCNGTPFYFYETRGCQAPVIHNLGAANINAHEYSIYKLANNTWDLRIDGALKVNINPVTNPAFQCGPAPSGWLNSGNNKAVWMGRKWDGYGDSFGDGGPGALLVDARYGLFNVGWQNPGWPTNPFQCQYETSQFQDTCNLQGGDDLVLWTD